MKKIHSKLTDEEQDLLGSVERGEWKPIPHSKKEIKKTQKIAENTMEAWAKENSSRGVRTRIRLNKDARINIRLISSDLDRLKKIAEEEGIPYQTFIASILHKFAIGKLKNAA